MLGSWSVLLVLFSVALAVPQGKVKDGGVLPVQVKEIITSINNYLEDRELTTVPLLNMTPSFGFLHITDGKLGMFNTIQLQKDPILTIDINKNGTTTYLFDVNLGLNPLRVYYRIQVKVFTITKTGGVTITPRRNTLRVKGSAVVGTGGRCSAVLSRLEFTRMEDFKIEISPANFPYISKTNQIILNFVVPKLLPLANIAIKTSLLPILNKNFGGLVCKNIALTNDIV